jgi:predicted DCC family thiol-disulfide oxidoreductase YuxK
LKLARNVTPSKLTLFYDGSCPLCVSEIGYYKRSDREKALEFIDVSSERFSGDGRINRTEAMARFHVRLADGRQVSGAQAFVEVWRLVPGWRWLARLAGLPGAVRVLEVFYSLFLRARPVIVSGFTKMQKVTGRSS